MKHSSSGLALLLLCLPAQAGPPYVTDDPEPTEYRHFEIYAFGGGTDTIDGEGGAAGIDFNYGGAPDLQLTAVVPWEYDSPTHAGAVTGIGNIELAAKYKLLHQEDFGVDVAVFPRVFLPSASRDVGDRHASLLLPVWIGKDFGAWSTFGGGGCALNDSKDSQSYCLLGWAVTRQLTPSLRVGAELYHRSADARDGLDSTGIGAGAVYDLTENHHLMMSVGPGIQNASATDRMSWYAALLSTF